MEIDCDLYIISIFKYIIEFLDFRGYLELFIEEFFKELGIFNEDIEKVLKVV